MYCHYRAYQVAYQLPHIFTSIPAPPLPYRHHHGYVTTSQFRQCMSYLHLPLSNEEAQVRHMSVGRMCVQETGEALQHMYVKVYCEPYEE